MVRAKFKVESVTHFEGPHRQVKLRAVLADEIPENQRFHQYTPSGELTLSINNPPASDVFTPGKSFYVDFTEVK